MDSYLWRVYREEGPGGCRAFIRRHLRSEAGNVTRAAAAIGVSRPFLHWMMRRLGISREAIVVRREARAYFRLWAA
jgi:DNA-binding NtrC family response regulator